MEIVKILSSASMKSVGNKTKATLKQQEIMYHIYIVANTLYLWIYSLHFHSIITSDEKQKIASSIQIINTQSSHFTNQILTFQCYFPLMQETLSQSWNWLENF